MKTHYFLEPTFPFFELFFLLKVKDQILAFAIKIKD